MKSRGRISLAEWLEPCPDVHVPQKTGHSWGSLPPLRFGFSGEAQLCPPLCCSACCRAWRREGRPAAVPSACRALPLGTGDCFHGNRTMDCFSRKRLNLICVELGCVCVCVVFQSQKRGEKREGRICIEPPIFPDSQGDNYFR